MSRFLTAVFVLLFASLAAADTPTTAPSTQPTTKPLRLPSASELMKQFQAAAAAEDAKLKVAMIDLNDAVVEKPAAFSLFSSGGGLPLRSVIGRLHKARDDENVKGLLLTFGASTSFGLAQAQEIRDAVEAVRKAGKKVFVYSDTYDTATYTVASAATDICMLEAGEITMPGVALETMFYRGTMDKVGITPDFIQIGEFKGAEEPYTRTQPSDELRGELNKLVESIYTMSIDSIANARGLSRDTVRRAIDDTMVNGPEAKERGLVDHLLDQDGLRPLIEAQLGGEMKLVTRYGEKPREEIDWSNIFSVFKAMSRKPEATRGPTIALVYAEGVISDGDGEGGLLDEAGVGSETMREAFREVAKDNNVKAVVIRIDSPGGSALASEVMWQAIRRVAKDKPVIISIGGMAASGGYYLASAGDYIFADPAAIVGSIGVVGGKFVTKDLFEKIGLSTETFAKGRNADLYSSNRVWDEAQRKLVRKSMEDVYRQFTQRIMTTRSGKIGDIDKIARGRIFLATEAIKLGMVDELGGIEAALKHAADKAGLDAGKYEVKTFPEPRTLADLLGGGTEARLPFKPSITVSPDSILFQIAPGLRKAVLQQAQMMKLLEKRAVVLMAPFTLTIR